MNKKIITAAVASALAVPAAVSAQETTVTTYGRINNAIQYDKAEGSENSWGLRNVVSRLGFKAKSDLGNGLSAIGRYEFFTFTNREGNFDSVGGKGRGGINDTRLGYVGLSGAWGAVTIGNQWSAFYDTLGTHFSQSYSVGYFLYSSVMGGPFRTSNTIKYANSFGPAYIELDVRMSNNVPPTNADEEVLGRDSGDNAAIDGVGLGGSFNIGESFTLAAAYDVDKKDLAADDNTRYGLAGKFNAGNWWLTLGYYALDDGSKDDMWHIQGGTSFGKTNLLLAYSQASVGADAGGRTGGDPTQWLLNINHNMGGGFRVYYEGVLYDDDNSGSRSDIDVHLFGMRYDFST